MTSVRPRVLRECVESPASHATRTGRFAWTPGLMLSGHAARCQAGTTCANDGPVIHTITFTSPCDEHFVTFVEHVCRTVASMGERTNAHDALTMW